MKQLTAPPSSIRIPSPSVAPGPLPGLNREWLQAAASTHDLDGTLDDWAHGVVHAVAGLLPDVAGIGLLVLEHTEGMAQVKTVVRAVSREGLIDLEHETAALRASTTGVVVHPAPGVVISLCAIVSATSAVTRYERVLLGRIGMHLETGYRLRSEPSIVTAEIDATGKVTRRPGREDVEQWTSLVTGHESLVERGPGQSRHYVAIENHPTLRASRALSESEIAVLAHAACGEPTKVIAYTLGLPASTVSLRLASAAAKLGVASTIELVRLAALLRGPARGGASEAAITEAERDVLELLQHGLSNREIAQMRDRSVRTIANQVSSLLRKTGSSSRRALLTLARVSA